MDLQEALNLALAGNLEALRAFLSQGGDANAALSWGRSALHVLSEMPYSHFNEKTVELLLKKGAAKTDVRDGEGRTPLHLAARVNLGAMNLLIQSGAEVDARDGRGVTPLHLAVAEGSHASTEALAFTGREGNDVLSGGARVPRRGPAHRAANRGQLPERVESPSAGALRQGLAAMFRSLKSQSQHKEVGWNVCAQLDALETDVSDVSNDSVQRKVRQLGPVVTSEEVKGKKRKFDIKILKSEAAAAAHVASLASGAPSPAPKARVPRVKTANLQEAKGFLSVWANANLDPKGTLDGKGGPLGWFDHDNWETPSNASPSAISRLSYAGTFSAALLDRLRELEIPETARLDVLFGYRLSDSPGKKPYGWFVGSFPYETIRASSWLPPVAPPPVSRDVPRIPFQRSQLE